MNFLMNHSTVKLIRSEIIWLFDHSIVPNTICKVMSDRDPGCSSPYNELLGVQFTWNLINGSKYHGLGDLMPKFQVSYRFVVITTTNTKEVKKWLSKF